MIELKYAANLKEIPFQTTGRVLKIGNTREEGLQEDGGKFFFSGDDCFLSSCCPVLVSTIAQYKNYRASKSIETDLSSNKTCRKLANVNQNRPKTTKTHYEKFPKSTKNDEKCQKGQK